MKNACFAGNFKFGPNWTLVFSNRFGYPCKKWAFLFGVPAFGGLFFIAKKPAKAGTPNATVRSGALRPCYDLLSLHNAADRCDKGRGARPRSERRSKRVRNFLYARR